MSDLSTDLPSSFILFKLLLKHTLYTNLCKINFENPQYLCKDYTLLNILQINLENLESLVHSSNISMGKLIQSLKIN